jgi:hypothetical protein
MEESFPALWEKQTVHFGMETGGGRFFELGIPFIMTGGRGDAGSEFPLNIAATLMDSLLIEAGLKHYASLLAMTPEEEADFRSVYQRRYDPANHLLIWCELQTNWAEPYLDPARWIIFIVDDASNQYEPVEILEESQPFRQLTMEGVSEFQPEQARRAWQVHQKTFMFCFPKRDFSENPILSKKVQFLKLVFQLAEDRETRAEGAWVFKE